MFVGGGSSGVAGAGLNLRPSGLTRPSRDDVLDVGRAGSRLIAMADLLCPVVVGRARELEALRRALIEARSGRGSVAVLVGEAGIGKSRLARELVADATATGMVVLRGRAVPA